jgi:hypothetical protein
MDALDLQILTAMNAWQDIIKKLLIKMMKLSLDAFQNAIIIIILIQTMCAEVLQSDSLSL